MPLAGRAAAVLTLVLAFIVQLVGGLNPDVSWLLTVGERMLAGQQLYLDIYELNPPMSALLYLPFVVLAQSIGVAAEPIVIAAMLGLAVLSLALSATILRRGQLLARPGLWFLVSLVALTIFPGDDFGEREHIAVMLLLPLLALSAVRSTGTTPALGHVIVVGLAAGLAMAIKPHFALPIFGVALYSAVQARSWRPMLNLEHVLGGLTLIAYWLAVWTWFPSFFSNMLPIASVAYVADRQLLFALFIWPALPVWLVLAGLLLLYRREMISAPNGQYLAAAAGFFLAYLLQGKGFVYHLLPTLLLVSTVFAQSFVARNAQGSARLIPMALAVAFLAVPGLLDLRDHGLRHEAMRILAPLGPGLSFANITSQLEIASPLHRDLGGTLVNSGPCLWITIGALRRYRSTSDAVVQQEMLALDAFERGRLRDDMLANPPDIILAGADRFDWLAWARQDAVLAAILDDYDVLVSIGPEASPLHILQRKAI